MKMIAGDGGRDEEWKLVMEVDVYWRLSIRISSEVNGWIKEMKMMRIFES
jgi:hypothetical protein